LEYNSPDLHMLLYCISCFKLFLHDTPCYTPPCSKIISPAPLCYIIVLHPLLHSTLPATLDHNALASFTFLKHSESCFLVFHFAPTYTMLYHAPLFFFYLLLHRHAPRCCISRACSIHKFLLSTDIRRLRITKSIFPKLWVTGISLYALFPKILLNTTFNFFLAHLFLWRTVQTTESTKTYF